MRFIIENNALICQRQGETLHIEPWGQDALRVRSTMYPDFTGRDWALTEKPTVQTADIAITKEKQRDGDGIFREYLKAVVVHGRVSAVVNHGGVITFYRDGKMILREHFRNYGGSVTRESKCLKVVSREWKPYTGGDYRLTVRFEPNDGEKIFGMGQSAALYGYEGLRAGDGTAQQPGQRALHGIKLRVWPSVEQSGHREGFLWQKRDRMAG